MSIAPQKDFRRSILDMYFQAFRITLALLVPLGGLAGGVWILFYVITKKHPDEPSVPFWMLLSGALIFTFLPLVLHILISLTFPNKRQDLHSD